MTGQNHAEMHETAVRSPPVSPRDARSQRHRTLEAAQELFRSRALDALSSLLDSGLRRASDQGRSEDS